MATSNSIANATKAEITSVSRELLEITLGRYQLICHDPRYIADFVALCHDEIRRVLDALVQSCTSRAVQDHHQHHHRQQQRSVHKNTTNKEHTQHDVDPQRKSNDDEEEGEGDDDVDSDAQSGDPQKGGGEESSSDGGELNELDATVAPIPGVTIPTAQIHQMDKLQRQLVDAEQKMRQLQGMVERREKLLKEQRSAFFREILVAKEMIAQLQDKGTTELSEVTMAAWGSDPLNEEVVGQRDRIEAEFVAYKSRMEKDREGLVSQHRQVVDDLRRQIISLHSIMRDQPGTRDHAVMTDPVDFGVMLTPPDDDVDVQPAEPSEDASTATPRQTPRQLPPITCPKCGEQIVLTGLMPGGDSSHASYLSLSTQPDLSTSEQAKASTPRTAATPPVTPRAATISLIDGETQTTLVEYSNMGAQTVRPPKKPTSNIGVQTQQSTMPDTSVVMLEDKQPVPAGLASPRVGDPLDSSMLKRLQERDRDIEDLKKQLAAERDATGHTQSELGEVKNQLFILKAKLLEHEEVRHKYGPENMAKLKDALLEKDELLDAKAAELNRLQLELDRVLEYHTKANITDKPGPAWNMSALNNMRRAILDAEENEAAYRLDGWRHLMQAFRARMMLNNCRAELTMPKSQNVHAHEQAAARRHVRNMDVLDLHFKRKIAEISARRMDSQEAANAHWDRVLFLARSVVHCVQAEERPTPRAMGSHLCRAVPDVIPQRPVSAPHREPALLSRVVLEASAPAGTAVQLRSSLSRPQTAGIRRGPTCAPQPPDATASPPHKDKRMDLAVGCTAFDPRPLMVIDAVAKRQRLLKSQRHTRQHAIASDGTVLHGLEPSTRRLASAKAERSSSQRPQSAAQSTNTFRHTVM